jgi:signal transduction histidine kinase/HPt (histidine-containing phosphotransfer) domain-containing protein
VLYTLSHHYLFLPFVALCMTAALLQANANLVYMALPIPLQIAAALCGNRLKTAYDRRGNDDPALWARRATIFSGIVGAIWGLGAVLWFDWSSFSAEAYLVLAYLGMSATEFIARAAYRPAYLAHAIPSLGPLATMLALQGGLYQLLSALLLIFFGGALYFYGETLGRLLDQTILLRNDNAQLIVRLNEEKRSAEATRDAAQASELVKSTFISNISHELRTPLNAILGMAQLLERSDLEKAQRDHVKVLLEAGRGLKTLLDDIIALTSQSDESTAAPEEGCDAAQAARTVARLLQPNAWEKRLRLSVNVASGLPRVAVDPRLLRRVLLKLIGNAIKFTERGNVEIALDAIAGAQQNPMVRFVIVDTGPGIPGHLLNSIFLPFGKGDDSYSARRASAGVGLSVAKRLIESVGGSIGVESEPGMGASFWITVPATQTQATDEDDEVEGSAAPSGLALLAFVDRSDREVLDPLLTPFGNRITFVDTLVQASTMSTRGGYDMILATAGSVDVLAAAPGQRTPILGLTARDERQPEAADGVLRWPATSDALYSAITAVIGEGARKKAGAKEHGIDAAIDAKAIADLEKTLGFKTLIDILQSYVHTAEELASAIFAASERQDWSQAGRLAQDFAGAAGGLGLVAIAAAARSLAQGARDGATANVLSAAADQVLSEDRRVREALHRLYPDLSA